MILLVKFAAAGIAAILGSGAVCLMGGPRAIVADVRNPMAAQQPVDTATVRLHISGMTCGSCPITARTALKKLPGVVSATVTLDDSLGVVRYASRKVTPAQIAAHLTKLTGYGARVIADSAKAPRRSGAAPVMVGTGLAAAALGAVRQHWGWFVAGSVLVTLAVVLRVRRSRAA